MQRRATILGGLMCAVTVDFVASRDVVIEVLIGGQCVQTIVVDPIRISGRRRVAHYVKQINGAGRAEARVREVSN